MLHIMKDKQKLYGLLYAAEANFNSMLSTFKKYIYV